MLRSDEIVALDQVTEICQLVSDRFVKLAEWTDDAALAGLFTEIAEQHRQYVTQLDHLVEKMGELPRRLDPDRELLEEWTVQLRTIFSNDKSPILLNKATETEEEVQRQIGQALAQDEMPAEGLSLLRRLRQQVQAALDRLKAAA